MSFSVWPQLLVTKRSEQTWNAALIRTAIPANYTGCKGSGAKTVLKQGPGCFPLFRYSYGDPQNRIQVATEAAEAQAASKAPRSQDDR